MAALEAGKTIRQIYDEIICPALNGGCEEERDALQEKVDTLTHHIKELINQYYQRYIKTEEIIPELEKLI